MSALETSYSGRRALVAGGAGFVGSHLCDALLALGAEVLAWDSLLTGEEENLSDASKSGRLVFEKLDVTCPLPEVAGPLDFVFNLASPASPVHYANHPIETLRVGSLGTEHLLRLALAKGATFLQASTSEVYGDPQVHPQGEGYHGNVDPVGPRSVYDEAKRYGEALCAAFERSLGARVRIARIFNTYGPRMQLDDGRVVPNFIRQALRGEPLTVYGEGSQTRSFCYVSDLVGGLLRLAASEVQGPVNLGSEFEYTIADLAHLLIEITGSHSSLTHAPLPPGDPQLRRPNLTRARELLGWEPTTPVREGLEKTLAFFRPKLR